KQAMRLCKRQRAELQRVNAVDALRAVSDINRRIEIIEEDADNFAETECDNRQIIATQAQCRCAEQRAEPASDQCSRRQQQPWRQMQPEVRRGEQCITIGADREERDVAEIEQPGETNYDVEAE